MQVPEIHKSSVDLFKQELELNGTSTSFPGVVYLSHLPSYDELFRLVFLKNQLCVVNSGVTSSWKSRELWVCQNGSPDFDYISNNFGESIGPVADCNAEEFSSHPKSTMKVKDYISYWQQYKADGYPVDAKCLYLKDWHFNKCYPDYSAYTPPAFLCSDWLNEYWDTGGGDGGSSTDDYRFVYMGPKGSWTPFHADVLRSYSWSANICGKKKWIFFPPGLEEHLKDVHGQLVFDLRSGDLLDTDKYPHARTALEQAIVVEQLPGEIIFVPSGWHHQVFNMEDTISINHNWLNGCSIHHTWQYLKSRLCDVRHEIHDCFDMDGWDEQCQVILKADVGMDYAGFYDLMITVARNRISALNEYLKQLKGDSKTTLSNGSELDFYSALDEGNSQDNVKKKRSGGRELRSKSRLRSMNRHDTSTGPKHDAEETNQRFVSEPADIDDGSALSFVNPEDGDLVNQGDGDDKEDVGNLRYNPAHPFDWVTSAGNVLFDITKRKLQSQIDGFQNEKEEHQDFDLNDRHILNSSQPCSSEQADHDHEQCNPKSNYSIAGQGTSYQQRFLESIRNDDLISSSRQYGGLNATTLTEEENSQSVVHNKDFVCSKNSELYKECVNFERSETLADAVVGIRCKSSLAESIQSEAVDDRCKIATDELKYCTDGPVYKSAVFEETTVASEKSTSDANDEANRRGWLSKVYVKQAWEYFHAKVLNPILLSDDGDDDRSVSKDGDDEDSIEYGRYEDEPELAYETEPELAYETEPEVEFVYESEPEDPFHEQKMMASFISHQVQKLCQPFLDKLELGHDIVGPWSEEEGDMKFEEEPEDPFREQKRITSFISRQVEKMCQPFLDTLELSQSNIWPCSQGDLDMQPFYEEEPDDPFKEQRRITSFISWQVEKICEPFLDRSKLSQDNSDHNLTAEDKPKSSVDNNARYPLCPPCIGKLCNSMSSPLPCAGDESNYLKYGSSDSKVQSISASRHASAEIAPNMRTPFNSKETMPTDSPRNSLTETKSKIASPTTEKECLPASNGNILEQSATPLGVTTPDRNISSLKLALQQIGHSSSSQQPGTLASSQNVSQDRLKRGQSSNSKWSTPREPVSPKSYQSGSLESSKINSKASSVRNNTPVTFNSKASSVMNNTPVTPSPKYSSGCHPPKVNSKAGSKDNHTPVLPSPKAYKENDDDDDDDVKEGLARAESIHKDLVSLALSSAGGGSILEKLHQLQNGAGSAKTSETYLDESKNNFDEEDEKEDDSRQAQKRKKNIHLNSFIGNVESMEHHEDIRNQISLSHRCRLNEQRYDKNNDNDGRGNVINTLNKNDNNEFEIVSSPSSSSSKENDNTEFEIVSSPSTSSSNENAGERGLTALSTARQVMATHKPMSCTMEKFDTPDFREEFQTGKSTLFEFEQLIFPPGKVEKSSEISEYDDVREFLSKSLSLNNACCICQMVTFRKKLSRRSFVRPQPDYTKRSDSDGANTIDTSEKPSDAIVRRSSITPTESFGFSDGNTKLICWDCYSKRHATDSRNVERTSLGVITCELPQSQVGSDFLCLYHSVAVYHDSTANDKYPVDSSVVSKRRQSGVADNETIWESQNQSGFSFHDNSSVSSKAENQPNLDRVDDVKQSHMTVSSPMLYDSSTDSVDAIRPSFVNKQRTPKSSEMQPVISNKDDGSRSSIDADIQLKQVNNMMTDSMKTPSLINSETQSTEDQSSTQKFLTADSELNTLQYITPVESATGVLSPYSHFTQLLADAEKPASPNEEKPPTKDRLSAEDSIKLGPHNVTLSVKKNSSTAQSLIQKCLVKDKSMSTSHTSNKAVRHPMSGKHFSRQFPKQQSSGSVNQTVVKHTNPRHASHGSLVTEMYKRNIPGNAVDVAQYNEGHVPTYLIGRKNRVKSLKVPSTTNPSSRSNSQKYRLKKNVSAFATLNTNFNIPVDTSSDSTSASQSTVVQTSSSAAAAAWNKRPLSSTNYTANPTSPTHKKILRKRCKQISYIHQRNKLKSATPSVFKCDVVREPRTNRTSKSSIGARDGIHNLTPSEKACQNQKPFTKSETEKKPYAGFQHRNLNGFPSQPKPRSFLERPSPSKDHNSVDPPSPSKDHNSSSSLSSINHNVCPHWAHCGPYLALFDLNRVADLIKDFQSQTEFESIRDGLSVHPSRLIDEIDKLNQKMK